MNDGRDKLYDYKMQELQICRNEIIRRISLQFQIFSFFYALSGGLWSYSLIEEIGVLSLIIPVFVSIGEIQILFNKLAELKLANYIKKEIEEKLNDYFKDKELMIWWESYVSENLEKGGKYYGPYCAYLLSRFSLFSVFFIANFILGGIWLANQYGLIIIPVIFISYVILYIAVLYFYLITYRKRFKITNNQNHNNADKFGFGAKVNKLFLFLL